MPKISRDLEFLMQCFREVLEEQGLHEISARLPWLGADAGLHEASLSERLAQSRSTAFHLLNMVEENATAQHRRSLQTAGRLGEDSGSWEQSLRRLREAGLSDLEISQTLPTVRIEPVLTAHPTEAKRATILEHHRELYLLLVQCENQMWTLAEQEDIRNRIKAVLERLWHTGEIFLERKDVPSELANIIHYLRNVFPSVLLWLHRRLREAWQDSGLDPGLLKDRFPIMPKLSFGDWVGGDRDGHPFVTARVTADTLGLLRRHAIELIAEHLTRLAARLSLSERLQVPDNELRERVTALAERLGARGRAGIQRNRDEPWATVHQFDAGFAADSELGGRGGAQRREFPLPAGR